MTERSHRENWVWIVIILMGLMAILGQIVSVLRSPNPIDRSSFQKPDPVDPGVRQIFSAQPDEAEHRSDLLVDAIIQIESGGNSHCVGRAGERGLMQIKKATWNEVTKNLYGSGIPFDRAFEPEMNRIVGKAYLRSLHGFLQRHRDQWRSDERSLLLASYNAGPTAVKKAEFDIQRLSTVTRSYVSRGSALHTYLMSEANLGQASIPEPVAPDPRSGS